MVPGGKALARLPQVDGIYREAQVGGNLLERQVVLSPPVFERDGKAGTNVALQFARLGHGASLKESRPSGERFYWPLGQARSP